MPSSTFRSKSTGQTVTVEHPAGATPEEIKELARSQMRGTSAPRPPASPTPAQPDMVGRAKEWLTKEPPAGSRTMFGETDMPGRVVRAAGDLFLPGTVPEAARMAATLPIGGGLYTAPLKRIGAGAVAGTGASLAQGRDAASSIMEGGSQGLSQLAGELLPGALRFGLTQRTGSQLLRNRDAKSAHDRAMHEAVTTSESEGYKSAVADRRASESSRIREARAQHQETVRDLKARHEAAQTSQTSAHVAREAAAKTSHESAKRAYAEQGAETIAESFKAQVPAFSEFASNERGLLDMVYGQGPARMGARFDEAMKAVVAAGKGVTVGIPLRDAYTLRLRFDVKNTKTQERGREIATVDAGQLAEAATGFWKTDHGVYRRAVAALDRAGIGDPASRAEYRAGQALIQFTDKSGMLKGEKFNPEAAQAAFTSLKKVDELRRRGQGDIFRGPVSEAVRRPAPELSLPTEPTPLQPPTLPVFRRPTASPEVPKPPVRVFQEPKLPEGVQTRTMPKLGFWSGAAVAEIPFLAAAVATGHHGYSGYGLPVAVGGLVSSALSGRRIVTDVPRSGLSRFATDVLPSAIAQESRRALPSALTLQQGQGPSTEEVDRRMQERGLK